MLVQYVQAVDSDVFAAHQVFIEAYPVMVL
jgi:hypothetical protein